jgi:hypothetical protein
MISFWFPCITPFDIRLFHFFICIGYNGFRKHFSNLAVPIFDPDFNYKSSDITDYEIDIITELATQEDIPEPNKDLA